MGLQDVVQGLLFLLYNPQLDDPLAGYIPSDMETFEKHVKQANEGNFISDEVEAECCMDEDEIQEKTWFNHSKVLKEDNWDDRDFVSIEADMMVPMKTVMRRVDSIINKSSQRWTEMEQWQSCVGAVNSFGAHPIAY